MYEPYIQCFACLPVHISKSQDECHAIAIRIVVVTGCVSFNADVANVMNRKI
jgi:hypothetical protein